jgi:hypothetical protein
MYVLKKSGRVFLALTGLYLMMAIFLHTDFGVLIAFIMGMLSITSFAYDEQAKWDAYALTMPVTKREMVAAKYLLSLLLGVAGGLIGLLLSMAAAIGRGPIDITGILVNTGIAICATYVFSSIALPLVYKLGSEKSRLVLMLCYAAPILLGTILINMLQDASITMPDLLSIAHTAAIILPFFTLASLAVSYRISLSVFEKKDV